jgi:hypothetical protein
MSNHSFSRPSRRDLLSAALFGGLSAIAGCNDPSGVQPVTSPPVKSGTRARMEKYKDTAQRAAEKNIKMH